MPDLKPHGNLDWIIFYDDGTIATSDDDIREIPRLGVQVVAQYNKTTNYDLFRTDGDYFVYDEDRGGWRITDMFGVWDHLNTVKYPLVLFGRNMADDAFVSLLQKVNEICGHKAAWQRRERRPL
jgi:hypothetical protein